MGYVFSLPTINDWGEVAFRVEEYILGEGYYRPAAWEVSRSGVIRRVAQRGMAPPGAETIPFDSFLYMSGNGLGQTAFYGLFENDGNWFDAPFGLWASNVEGELRLVAKLEHPADGTNKVFSRPFSDSPYNSIPNPFVVSKLGQVAFLGEAIDPDGVEPNQYGIWAEDPFKQLRLVALGNAPIAGYADGTIFRGLRRNSLEIADDGRVSFVAEYFGPTTSIVGGVGIWREKKDGKMQMVIGTGEPLPGPEPGIYLSSILNLNTNNRGDVVFRGTSQESRGPSLVNRKDGYWIIENSGQTSLLAMEDAPVPGIELGRFSEIISIASKDVLLNGSGDAAFMAKFYGPGITDEDDTALWLRRANGVFQMVAREGDTAPNGSIFGSFLQGDTSMSLSNSGQIVFLQNNGGALWGANWKNEIKLIAQVGQKIDVNDGPQVDLRTIQSINLLLGTGGEDGWRSSFNDRGQVVFVSRTGNFSSAVFLSNALEIPEPSSSVILTGILLTMARLWNSRLGNLYDTRSAQNIGTPET